MATTSMNIETLEQGTTPTNQLSPKAIDDVKKKKPINWPLLILSCCFAAIGVIGGPLLTRLYYIHGGKRRWVSTLMQSAGFPILILPLIFLFFRSHGRSKQSLSSSASSPSPFFMEPKLYIFSAIAGIFIGVDNFMYTLGLAFLPVSTSSILYATQLAFIAVFAWIIVRQKFSAFTINAVVLMTLGSVMLGLRANGDRPAGVSNSQYLMGYFLTLGSAALLGFLWPCIELCYSRAKREVNYTVVLQFQLNVAIFATFFSIVGMLVNKDFQAMRREVNEYGLGSGMYIVVLAGGAVAWQLSYVGGLGIIYCIGSLFNGIFTSVMLPITEIAAVVAYRETFNGEKGMALVLCIWGFISYFYGEYKNRKNMKSEEAKEQEI